MKKNYYLIDTENVGDRWMDFIGELGEEDVLVVFYTRNHSKMLEETYLRQRYNKKIRWIECLTGSNALDHQLMGVLSYLVATHTDASYAICSNDKDYQDVIDFWGQRGVAIGTVGFDTSRKGCRWQKMDLAEEQTGQSEGRKPASEGGSGHGAQPQLSDGGSGESRGVQTKGAGHGTQPQLSDGTSGEGRGVQTRGASRGAQPQPSDGAAGESRGAQTKGIGGEVRNGREVQRPSAEEPEDRSASQSQGRDVETEDAGNSGNPEARNHRKNRKQTSGEETRGSQTGRRKSQDKESGQKQPADETDGESQLSRSQAAENREEERIVAEIARSIPVSNLGNWYTVLVSLLGQEAGLEYYRKLKKDEAWRAELSRHLLKDAHERNVYLIALLYKHHHLDVAKAAEAYKLINAHNRKNKKAIHADFEKHFGKKTEEQNRYYKVVKPIVDVLKGK